MSPAHVTRLQALKGFPRVSGDEPPGKAIRVVAGAFSPRERG